MRLSQQLWFPGGVLLVCAVVLQLNPRVLSVVEPYLTPFFLLVLAVGAVLGWMYNRGRIVVSLAMYGLAAWLLYPAISRPAWQLQIVALLLPLNLILFSLLPDRSLLASSSVINSGLLAVEALALTFLPRSVVPRIEFQLERSPLPANWFHWSWIGQPALLAFCLAAILLAGLFLRERRPTDRGLFWALLAAFVATLAADRPRLTLLYFGSGAIILVISLIEHAHGLAYRDALTGLANRRALDEFLPQLHGAFSLAMVDIDHFKQFNDTYGHDAGDQVLRKVAGHLAAVTGGGRAFRYGGEEFSVVFPGQSRNQALPHLEALRARIEDAAFSLRGSLRPQRKPKERRSRRREGRKVHVTVSIGVAELTGELTSALAVIEAADRALYRAKQEGRNQVQCA